MAFIGWNVSSHACFAWAHVKIQSNYGAANSGASFMLSELSQIPPLLAPHVIAVGMTQFF